MPEAHGFCRNSARSASAAGYAGPGATRQNKAIKNIRHRFCKSSSAPAYFYV
jgi:hypothetical protein